MLNFLGAEIDPAAGKTTNFLTIMEQIIAKDDGLLLLRITRNAIDMGPSGTNDPPVITLGHIYSDVMAGAAATTTTGTPADRLTATLNRVVAFFDDHERHPALHRADQEPQ